MPFTRPLDARAVTSQDLDMFVAAVQKIVTDHHTTNHFSWPAPEIKATMGPRFARIVRTENNDSVYCFVDVSNGDILKSASWKAPAKHPRGNIFNTNPTQGCNSYGAEYMR